ncbi:MAG: hypothetical protein K8S18_09785 [Desulfobacula sp.]|nr:hypothetical protein [Desulfobacula sp.]
MTDQDLDILAKKISLQLLSMEEYLDKIQASAYAKIGQKRLVSLVKQGKIKGYPDQDNKGQWIFSKSSLKQYRLSKMEAYDSYVQEDIDEEKILAVLRRKVGL